MSKISNSFVNRNLVAIVMIPSLIGVHFVWMAIQKNETLVRKDEQMELPIITGAKYLLKKFGGTFESNQNSSPVNNTKE